MTRAGSAEAPAHGDADGGRGGQDRDLGREHLPGRVPAGVAGGTAEFLDRSAGSEGDHAGADQQPVGQRLNLGDRRAVG